MVSEAKDWYGCNLVLTTMVLAMPLESVVAVGVKTVPCP
jgi:hypothetical protein